MRQLTQLKGLDLSALPELSLLKLETNNPNEDLAYTLLVDRAFSNITWLLGEESRRLPGNDRLTLVPGIVGSYPNIFFRVRKNELAEFKQMLKTARTEAELEQFYAKFGIRRTNPDIWEYADWFNQQNLNYHGLQAGLLDISRYENL
jgi:hypothetical protein